jgi:hypothetical protein
MLLEIFSPHGVLPLEFKPAYSIGDLLLQDLAVAKRFKRQDIVMGVARRFLARLGDRSHHRLCGA